MTKETKASKTYRLISIPRDWSPTDAVMGQFNGCKIQSTFQWDNPDINVDLDRVLDLIEAQLGHTIPDGDYVLLHGIIVDGHWVWQCRRPIIGIMNNEACQNPK